MLPIARERVRLYSIRCLSSTAATENHPKFHSDSSAEDRSNKKLFFASLNKETMRQEILQYWMLAEMKSSKTSCQRRARYCCYTYHDAKREYASRSSQWYWLDRELSSNLAGETGAVYIYKGALRALEWQSKWSTKQSSAVKQFCETHQETEESHRRFFDAIVPTEKRTRLLPLWRLTGLNLGFWSTLIGGSKALYVTVEAVEDFVEQHFQEQIVPLKKEQTCPELLKLLQACCEDEIHHKQDAARHLLGDDNGKRLPWWASPWSKVVKLGSAAAADVARRI